MTRYRKTFKFCDTEDEAKRFCESENQNRYIREHHPAHYTPWQSKNGKENKFVAWYVEK